METILVQEMDAVTREVRTTAWQVDNDQLHLLADHDENILDMIRRHHPKLVLLDYRLSYYSGKQITHWVKAHFPRLPVIAFSCDDNITNNYRKLGFDGYLGKSFNFKLRYKALFNLARRRIKRRYFIKPVSLNLSPYTQSFFA